jgi:hypothetical protein
MAGPGTAAARRAWPLREIANAFLYAASTIILLRRVARSA